jgi:hypothetical protein
MRRNPKEYGMYWEEGAGCPAKGFGEIKRNVS